MTNQSINQPTENVMLFNSPRWAEPTAAGLEWTVTPESLCRTRSTWCLCSGPKTLLRLPVNHGLRGCSASAAVGGALLRQLSQSGWGLSPMLVVETEWSSLEQEAQYKQCGDEQTNRWLWNDSLLINLTYFLRLSVHRRSTGSHARCLQSSVIETELLSCELLSDFTCVIHVACSMMQHS